MIRTRLLLSFLAFLAFVGASSRSVEAFPQESPDNFAISGTVLVSGTREAWRDVEVRLNGPTDWRVPLPGMRLGDETLIRTDASGRFSFTGLAAGFYTITAVASEDMEFARPIAASLELGAPGSLPADIELWMERRSYVTGRVLGPDGEPVVNARVSALMPIWYEGRRTLSGTAGSLFVSETDENGGYNLLIRPGRYYLGVDAGEGDTSFYRQYYPGVPTPDAATLVSVPSGVEVPFMDIHLTERTPGHRVRFQAPLPESLPGAPEPLATYVDQSDSAIEARLLRTGGAFETVWVPVTLDALGDDRHLTAPLPEGEYEMIVQYSQALLLTMLDTDVERHYVNPLARVRFTVDGDEIDADDDAIDLGTLPPVGRVSIPGRIVLRGDAADFEAPEPPGMVCNEYDFGWCGRFVPGQAGNGQFVFEGMPPGYIRFGYGQDEFPPGWYVASAMSGTHDVLRNGLELGGGVVSPLEVVLAGDAARVEGVARGADGRIFPGARVVLVPQSNPRGGLHHFPTAEADASGVYVLENVPPGEYRLLALDMAGITHIYYLWEDPEFLARFEPRAGRITVEPGARMVTDAEALPVFE